MSSETESISHVMTCPSMSDVRIGVKIVLKAIIIVNGPKKAKSVFKIVLTPLKVDFRYDQTHSIQLL